MAEKILIVGAGAIGGVVGAYMAMAGHDVTLFDVDERHVEKINKGLLIDGIRGKKIVKVKAVRRIMGKYDFIFLAVKSQHTDDALRRIASHMKENTVVVSLQNSINEERIAEKVGVARTIGCVIGWSATNVGPGHLRITSEGEFIIGRLDGKVDKRVERVKELLESFAPVKITNNILGYLWSKLLVNSSIASIGAIAVATLGEVVKNKKSLILLAAIANELVRVAEAADTSLEKFEGLDPKFFKIDDENDLMRVVAMLKMAGKKHAGLKSTILQDLEKGRKTEINYLNGYVEKKAAEIGMPTPLNKAIIGMIKEIEEGKRKLTPRNVEEIYRMVRIPKRWLEAEFKENDLQFYLFNLPAEYKLKNASTTAGVFLLGMSSAISKAFEKITKSFIGKIFVRKDKWEITNTILSKFLEEMGVNIARMVKEQYNLENNETGMGKIVNLVFNNLNMESTAKKQGKKVFIKMTGDCIFVEGAKKVGVTKKVNFPLCMPLLNGIEKEFNADFRIEDKKCWEGKECKFVIERK